MGFFDLFKEHADVIHEPEEESDRRDGRTRESSVDDSWDSLDMIELATMVFQAAMLTRPDCEPEDVTHNAIVAKRNALAMIEQLNKDSAPPPQ